MSTQVYPSHSQTRQQLEELDSLLQRMLDLPMRAEPAAVEPPSAPTYAPIAPPLWPPPAPLPRQNAPVETLPSAWRMGPPPDHSPQPVVPSPPPEIQFAVEAPASEIPYSMVYGDPRVEQLPPFAEPVAESARQQASSGWAIQVPNPERGRSALLLPIVIINRVFDALTYLLGPAGRSLRQGWGRTALGWVGIVMILCAVVWALADWVSWADDAGLDWKP